MKKLLFLLLPVMAIIIDSCTVAGNITSLTPSEISPTKPFKLPNPDEYEKKYPGQDAVYLFHDMIIEHSGTKEALGEYSFLSKWDYHRVTKYQYLILDPDKSRWSNMTLNYLPDSMYIMVFYPDSTVGHFGSTDFQKVKGDNGKDKYKFPLPRITRGTVVEYGDEITVDGQIGIMWDNDYVFQHSIPCESLYFAFAYPEWWTIQMKKIKPDTLAPFVESTNALKKKKIIYHSAKDIPAYEDEPYSPYFKEIGLYLTFKVTEFQMGNFFLKPQKNWSEISKYIFKEFFKSQTEQNKLIKWEVDNLTKNMDNPIAKLDTILGYLYGFELNDDNEDDINKIFQKKAGNSIGLTSLAGKMLQYAGIFTQVIVIHSAVDGYFDKDYIDMNQFATVALAATIDNKAYIVCPYLKYLPYNLIPEFLQNQPALVVAKNPVDPFWTTPPGDSSQNQYDAASDIMIKSDGTISIHEKRTLRGLAAYASRIGLKELNYDDQKKTIKELIGFTEGEVILDTFNIQNMDRYKEPLIIETDYHIDNLVTITPEEAIFQTAGLISPLSNVTLKIKPEERVNPIKIPYDEYYNRAVTIHFPSDWTIKTVLNDISFKNQFGSIDGKSIVAGDSLVITQNLTMKKSYEPKEKIAELLELTGRTSNLWIPAVVFEKIQ